MLITYPSWAFWLFTTLSSGGAAYFGAYLKKKGENVATSEDFAELIAQIKRTTEATKAIEERIAHEFSHKTRIWEMKQEALYDVLAALGKMEETLATFSAIVTSRKKKDYPPEIILEARVNVLRDWNNADRAYSAARAKSLVVCGGKVTDSMREAQKALHRSFRTLEADGVDEYMNNEIQSIMTTLSRFVKAVRDELDVHEHDLYQNGP